MELLVEITSTAGRLTGTVRRPPGTTAHPFSGNLELLACIERLTAGSPDTPAPGDRPGTRGEE